MKKVLMEFSSFIGMCLDKRLYSVVKWVKRSFCDQRNWNYVIRALVSLMTISKANYATTNGDLVDVIYGEEKADKGNFVTLCKGVNELMQTMMHQIGDGVCYIVTGKNQKMYGLADKRQNVVGKSEKVAKVAEEGENVVEKLPDDVKLSYDEVCSRIMSSVKCKKVRVRMLMIYELAQTSHISASKLSIKLGVEPRTIQRDFARLTEMGIMFYDKEKKEVDKWTVR